MKWEKIYLKREMVMLGGKVYGGEYHKGAGPKFFQG
jgi:hypothetical protein